ncbi:helix-turn-helix domain-containing protein [Mucilaginibacter sp. HD30]
MVPGILIKLAELLDTTVVGHRLNIPEKFGRGYCAGFIFNPHLRLLISDYELHQDLSVENPELNRSKQMIFFKLRYSGVPAVLIATSRLNTDELIGIHSNIATINIEVDADYLKGLLQPESRLLKELLLNAQPLLFELVIQPALQKIADEMVLAQGATSFDLLLLRIKAEELICRLLMELDKRAEQQVYPVLSEDVRTLYRVRDHLLANLERPTPIAELASLAAMSPTKLKRLFSQVFGNSIFSYYQEVRMKEATRLLKDERLSVSTVGYRLGFTNLSHFSRVFQAHIGLKPKQYSRS